MRSSSGRAGRPLHVSPGSARNARSWSIPDRRKISAIRMRPAGAAGCAWAGSLECGGNWKHTIASRARENAMSAGPSEIVRNKRKRELARDEVVSVDHGAPGALGRDRAHRENGRLRFHDVGRRTLQPVAGDDQPDLPSPRSRFGVAPFVRVPSTRPSTYRGPLAAARSRDRAPHPLRAMRAKSSPREISPFGGRLHGRCAAASAVPPLPAAEANRRDERGDHGGGAVRDRGCDRQGRRDSPRSRAWIWC